MKTVSRKKNYKAGRIETRVSLSQKRLFKEAARIYGTSLTDFVIHSAEEAAKRVVQEQEILHLSERDRDTFVSALLNPPQPHPRLRQAAEIYKAMIRPEAD